MAEGRYMLCPSCGHENSNLATRCAACGSALPTDVSNDTAPLLSSSQGDTAEQPRVCTEPPTLSLDKGPRLQEILHALGAFATAKGRMIGGFFRSHRHALGVVLSLFVVGALAAAWLVINLLDVPSYTQIEKDMAQLLPTYEYVGGTYGPDLQIPLSSVAVTKRSGTKTPEGMDANAGVGSVAYGVEAEATYDDGRIRVVRDVATTYTRSNDVWGMVGELTERGMSFSARAGVDENKVLSNIDTILDVASTGVNESLADVYSDGSFSIVGNSFKESADKDTAVNDVMIHCAKEDNFYSYEGTLTAHFAFESDSWVLRSAEANNGATTRSFSPLVGMWSGSLVSSTGIDAACYGARDTKLHVNIESVGDPSAGGGRVQGTITALAHFHNKPSSDQSSDKNDTLLENVAFTGVIQNEYDEETGSILTLECTTAGNPQGDLSFTLSFGSTDDPSAVFARVTSTHTYVENVLLFIPHQTMSRFVDTYQLSRA